MEISARTATKRRASCWFENGVHIYHDDTNKAKFFKAMAHPLRIQVLDELRAGPLSVGELQERTGAEQSTLSHQLGVLRARNLVSTQRKGTTVNFEVRDPAIWLLLDRTREFFDNHLVSVRAVLADLSREASK